LFLVKDNLPGYKGSQQFQIHAVEVGSPLPFWRFQDLGDIPQPSVVHDASECFNADGSLSDMFMPVSLAPQALLGIVQMNGIHAVQI
jgi:hypothetical protein